MSKPPRSSPGQPSPGQIGAVEQALEGARLAVRSGDPAEAERLAAGVLAAQPGRGAASQLLGTALLMQDRAAEAVAPLQRAARGGADPAVETLLGRALARSGELEAGLDQLRQACARRPAFPLAFLELGDQLSAAGRFDEGTQAFEAGLALAPQAVVLKIGLGVLCLQRNDRVRARALFLEVRAAAPERVDAVTALAKVSALEGDYAQAIELYRLALARRPDDAASRIELGKCLLEMGEREAGEAALRQAAGGVAELAGPAILALAAAPHGRFFLRRSDAERFLRVGGA